MNGNIKEASKIKCIITFVTEQIMTLQTTKDWTIPKFINIRPVYA